jgi:hypothetical protein
MTPQSEKAIEKAKNEVISLNSQINFIKGLPTSEMRDAVIESLQTILTRYTTEREIVVLTLPKEKWAKFKEFENNYKNE